MLGSVARYFDFFSGESEKSVLVRNFMCVAIAAIASICCSADCSSAQKSSAAVIRRSTGSRFQSFDGRKSL
jgi:hypothetical protein